MPFDDFAISALKETCFKDAVFEVNLRRTIIENWQSKIVKIDTQHQNVYHVFDDCVSVNTLWYTSVDFFELCHRPADIFPTSTFNTT